MQVVIVGGGIIGASCAFHLQAAGAAVTLLDAGTASATGASFGWINDSFYLDAAHHRLRAAGLESYRGFAGQLGLAINWCGSLSWEDHGDALHSRYKELRGLGVEVKIVGKRDFARLEPDVATPPEEALFLPAEGIADPLDLSAALLRAAQQEGARIVRGASVTGLIDRNGGCAGVRTALGDFAADQTLICAGTQTSALAGMLDVPLPLRASPALVVRTQALPQVARHVLSSEFGDVRQLPTGEIVTPAAVQHQANDAPANANPRAVADQTAQRLGALFGRDIIWSDVALAHRPVPADDRPVVGQALPGLYVAVMHSGITLAGIVGELAARETLKGPSNRSEDLLTPYRPNRFAGQQTHN